MAVITKDNPFASCASYLAHACRNGPNSIERWCGNNG